MKTMILCLVIYTGILTNASGQMTKQKWKEDIQYMLERVHTLHPNLYYKTSKAEFDAREKSLIASVDKSGDEEIMAGIASFLALAEDGHTELIPVLRGRSDLKLNYLKLSFRIFENKIYIRSASDSTLDHLVGARVLEWNGNSSDKILAKAYQYVSGDNDYLRREKVNMFLRSVDLLRGSGLIRKDKPINLKLKTMDGKEIQINAAIVNTSPFGHGQPERIIGDVPLYRQNNGRPYTLHHLPDAKMLYLNYLQIASDPAFPTRKLIDSINDLASRFAIEKIVIDIRNNGGGDLGFSIPLVNAFRQHPSLNEKGKLFIITGNLTFSAASFFLTKMQMNTRAITVGEPAGARPNHYGDARSVVLPNSGLFVRVSCYDWQNIFPNDNRTTTSPDLPVYTSAKSFFNHEDPALEIIKQYRLPAATEALSYQEAGIDSSLRFYLNPVLQARVTNTNGKAVVKVYDWDLEQRHYPYLTTRLYKSRNGFTTDIPGLILQQTDNTIEFVYKNVSYALIPDNRQLPFITEFDSLAFQRLLLQMDDFMKLQKNKVLPNTIFFSRTITSLLRNKRIDEGLQLVETGIRMMPQIYTLYYLKGELLNAKGQTQQALNAFKKASFINTDDQDLLKKIKEMENKLSAS